MSKQYLYQSAEFRELLDENVDSSGKIFAKSSNLKRLDLNNVLSKLSTWDEIFSNSSTFLVGDWEKIEKENEVSSSKSRLLTAKNGSKS